MTSSALLSTPQAASELGVSIRTIHRMVESGELKPAIKAPGKTGGYLFRPSVVDRAKAKRATKAES